MTPLHRHGRRLVIVMIALVGWVIPVSAQGAVASTAVTYHGYRLTVPAGWPVYRLQRDRSTCVRFDRHAVYLGRPGNRQRCPADAVGRTEAILVEQLRHPSGATGAEALAAPATAGGGRMAGQIRDRGRGIVVTATWNHRPDVIRRALGVRSLAALPRPAPASAGARAHALVRSVATARSSAVSTAGQIYTGAGFDACTTPSPTQMTAWGSSPYRALGVYIGGANMACAQPNLTAAWVNQVSVADWHLMPIYVGLQAPSNSCGCNGISPASAATEGAAAAADAMTDAQEIGLGAGNPLYLDMEAYTRTMSNTAAVMAFIQAWTGQLHAGGYRSGVYSSDNSGIVDLVARYGSGYGEPDDVWIANWNNAQTTADVNVPASEWAAHQRMHQYDGAHNERYGGVTINIDGDYVDAATAAAGASSGVDAAPSPAPTPALRVAPAANGSVNLTPSWRYATGVAAWQLLGGETPLALAPLGPPVAAGSRIPVVSHDAYSYYAVTALGPAGQELGTSPAVAAPAHLAIFGQSIFISRAGLGGVPLGCFNTTACTGVTVTVSLGRTTLVTTGRERIPVGGGLAYFGLTAAQHAQLWTARRHLEVVTIAVRSAAGLSTSRRLTLTSFSTAGRAPPRSLTGSALLRLVGTADFVSSGWIGGVLADCVGVSPCQATATIVAAGQVVAAPRTQTLGVGQLGYFLFTLTPVGHQLLMRAPGNQLAATVRLRSASMVATGRVVLSAYF